MKRTEIIFFPLLILLSSCRTTNQGTQQSQQAANGHAALDGSSSSSSAEQTSLDPVQLKAALVDAGTPAPATKVEEAKIVGELIINSIKIEKDMAYSITANTDPDNVDYVVLNVCNSAGSKCNQKHFLPNVPWFFGDFPAGKLIVTPSFCVLKERAEGKDCLIGAPSTIASTPTWNNIALKNALIAQSSADEIFYEKTISYQKMLVDLEPEVLSPDFKPSTEEEGLKFKALINQWKSINPYQVAWLLKSPLNESTGASLKLAQAGGTVETLGLTIGWVGLGAMAVYGVAAYKAKADGAPKWLKGMIPNTTVHSDRFKTMAIFAFVGFGIAYWGLKMFPLVAASQDEISKLDQELEGLLEDRLDNIVKIKKTHPFAVPFFGQSANFATISD